MVTNVADVLLTRLAQLEAEQTIWQIMSEYMHLCDDLSYHEVPGKIAELFTEDAIWEGVGDLYKKKLGHYRNRNAIKKMMESYVNPPPFFNKCPFFMFRIYQNKTTKPGSGKMENVTEFNI